MANVRQYYNVPPEHYSAGPEPAHPPKAEVKGIITSFCAFMTKVKAEVAKFPVDPNPNSPKVAFDLALGALLLLQKNALDSYPASEQDQDWRNARDAVKSLRGDPPVVTAWPPNMPAESPLELYYELLLNSVPVPAPGAPAGQLLAAGWGFLTDTRRLIQRRLDSVAGVPQVGTMCEGAQRLVVATNRARWGHFYVLDRWADDARGSSINSSLDAGYQTNAPKWTIRGLARFVKPRLQKAWDDAAAANKDQAVYDKWLDQCNLEPFIKEPRQFPPDPLRPRPNITTSISFDVHGNSSARGGVVKSRSRCRRCRVCWRFPMPTGLAVPAEPMDFDDGPFTDWNTCAEMLVVGKCVRSGL